MSISVYFIVKPTITWTLARLGNLASVMVLARLGNLASVMVLARLGNLASVMVLARLGRNQRYECHLGIPRLASVMVWGLLFIEM